MAAEPGLPSQFGISLFELRDLMESRGEEGLEKVQNVGGLQELCRKLNTSPINGNYDVPFFNYSHSMTNCL